MLPPITLDNNAGKFWEVLRQVQPEYGMAMGKTVISDAGFEAFREEADGWCQGLETDVEKMDTETVKNFTQKVIKIMNSGPKDITEE